MEKQQNLLIFLISLGGQNTDQILPWRQYQRQTSGDLLDLDLKEVVIRRAPGATIDFTVDNFVASDPLVTVSAGTAENQFLLIRLESLLI